MIELTIDSIRVSLMIVPYLSFRRGWRGDFVVNFAENNLMMTFGVKRGSSTAVKDKVRLVSYKKVDTRWIFVWGKISWFRNKLG